MLRRAGEKTAFRILLIFLDGRSMGRTQLGDQEWITVVQHDLVAGRRERSEAEVCDVARHASTPCTVWAEILQTAFVSGRTLSSHSFVTISRQ